MMKQTRHYRRILAAILAAVLTVGMSLTAFAVPGDSSVEDEGNGSITITNPKEDTTYYGYKIFDVTYSKSGDTKSYSYTIAGDSDWYSIVNSYATTGNGLALVKAAGADEYVVNITDGVFSAADFAKHLKDELAKSSTITEDFQLGPDDKEEGKPGLKKSGLALGYYFVLSKDGEGETQALCNLTTTNPDATIKDKNDTKFEKEISEIDSGAVTVTDPTNQDVQVGSVLTYTIKGDIPDRSGADTYYYHAKDTMSKGLEFQKPVTVKIGAAEITLGEVDSIASDADENQIKYTDASDANGGGFELSLDLMAKNSENEFIYKDADKIVITYKAVVTADAVEQIGENEAILKYGTDPDDLAESTPQKVKTWSSKIEVNKYEGNEDNEANTEKPLAGAKFVLRKKGSTAYYAAKKLKTEGETTEYELMTSTDTVPLFTTADLDKVEWVTPIDLDKPAELSSITVLTTDDLGKAIFAGLANGIYELIEVEAPAGYNLLDEPTTVELFTVAAEEPDADGKLVVKTGIITDKTDQDAFDAGGYTKDEKGDRYYTPQKVTAQVLNKSGLFLPSTGGIGTTIFYVLGSVLLVVAAAWFVISRRKVQIEEK